MIIPIRSATNPYDPNVGINHDGKISLSDLVLLAGSYSTTGDPTLPVNVTNPTYELYDEGIYQVWPTVPGAFTPSIYCGGFSELSILIGNVNAYLSGGGPATIYLSSIRWTNGNALTMSIDRFGPNSFNFTVSSGGYPAVYTIPQALLIQTKAPNFNLQFSVSGGSLDAWYYFNYSVYLRNY